MANATVTLVLDRIHAINGTHITGVKSSRYHPGNADSARLPLMTAYFGQRTTPAGVAVDNRHDTRVYDLVCIVGTFLGGLPSETAQRNAETVVERIIDAYATRPRLELNGNTALDGVVRATIGNDSGLEALDLGGNVLYAALRFPLTVTTRKTHTLEAST